MARASLSLPKISHDDVCSEHHVHAPGNTQPAPVLGLKDAQGMAEFFTVLSDPTRLRLISLLAQTEHCVCDLATQLSTTESAVSHQLRALRAARLVTYRKEGRQVFYQLHDQHVLALYRTVRDHLSE